MATKTDKRKSKSRAKIKKANGKKAVAKKKKKVSIDFETHIPQWNGGTVTGRFTHLQPNNFAGIAIKKTAPNTILGIDPALRLSDKTTFQIKKLSVKPIVNTFDFSYFDSSSLDTYLNKSLDLKAEIQLKYLDKVMWNEMYAGLCTPSEIDTNMATSDVIKNHLHYIRHFSGLPHFDDSYCPRFMSDFVWGPLGEWTGEVPDDSLVAEANFVVRNKNHSDWFPFGKRGVSYEAKILHPKMDSMFGGRSSYLGIRRRSYHIKETGTGSKFSAWFLAGMIQEGLLDEAVLWDWRSALESRQYHYGYDGLRDNSNRYDPFGVLADLNEVNWEWSEEDQVWGIDGATDSPYVSQIREWLDISGVVPNEEIQALVDWVQTATGQNSNFKFMAQVFLETDLLIQQRKKAINAAATETNQKRLRPKVNYNTAIPTIYAPSLDSLMIAPDPFGYLDVHNVMAFDPATWHEFDEKYDIV